MITKKASDKKSKIERMVGRKAFVSFIFGAGELFKIEDVGENRGESHPRYFLHNQRLAIPLSHTTFNNDGRYMSVNVPMGSSLAYQLNDLTRIE